MASDRFYFWTGYRDALTKLPDDAARGRFVMALCGYAFDGADPDFTDDPMLDFAWALVRDQVRESVEIGRKQAERGRRSGQRRRRKSASNGVPNSVPNGVPNVMNGNELGAEPPDGDGGSRHGYVPTDGEMELYESAPYVPGADG